NLSLWESLLICRLKAHLDIKLAEPYSKIESETSSSVIKFYVKYVIRSQELDLILTKNLIQRLKRNKVLITNFREITQALSHASISAQVLAVKFTRRMQDIEDDALNVNDLRGRVKAKTKMT